MVNEEDLNDRGTMDKSHLPHTFNFHEESIILSRQIAGSYLLPLSIHDSK